MTMSPHGDIAPVDPVIRRAHRLDLDLLIEMNAEYCAAEGVHADPARARAGLGPLLDDDTHGSIHVILNARGEPVGYAVLARSWSVEIGGAEVVLDELYVQTRGQGIGARAIEALAEWCRDHAVKRIFLETERPNHRARALYARHGFREDDSIWMSREL
jgi:GNAT superfamily N-acetyltransferase